MPFPISSLVFLSFHARSTFAPFANRQYFTKSTSEPRPKHRPPVYEFQIVIIIPTLLPTLTRKHTCLTVGVPRFTLSDFFSIISEYEALALDR